MALLGNPLDTLMSPLLYRIVPSNATFFPTESLNSYIFQKSAWSPSKYHFMITSKMNEAENRASEERFSRHRNTAVIEMDVKTTISSLFLCFQRFEASRQTREDII